MTLPGFQKMQYPFKCCEFMTEAQDSKNLSLWLTKSEESFASSLSFCGQKKIKRFFLSVCLWCVLLTLPNFLSFLSLQSMTKSWLSHILLHIHILSHCVMHDIYFTIAVFSVTFFINVRAYKWKKWFVLSVCFFTEPRKRRFPFFFSILW